MHQHRFQEQLELTSRPVLVAPALAASAFVVCPMVLVPQGVMGSFNPWQGVYQLAFEQAQAVVRPSRLERLQAVSWN